MSYRVFEGLLVRIAVISLLTCIQGIYGSSCRTESQEGWAWASSLKYTIPNSSHVLDFGPVHQSMIDRHTHLQSLLGGPHKNICLAQITFVLASNESGSDCSIVENIGAIAQERGIAIPLEKHVFISGTKKPDAPEGFRFISETERETDLKRKPHQADQYSTCQMTVTEAKEGEGDNYIRESVFIHPDKPYFLNLDTIIARLIARYHEVPADRLSVKAALAYVWNSIDHQDPQQASAMRNHWYKQATKACPNHSAPPANDNQDGKPESDQILFTNNADSEQKLFYYLDYITSYVNEFRKLATLMDQIEEWYEHSGSYKARLINCYMNYCDFSFTKIQAAIGATAMMDDQEVPSIAEIDNQLEALMRICRLHKEKRGEENHRLNRLEEYIQRVKQIFQALREGKETSALGLRKEILQKCKLGADKAENDNDFKQALCMYRVKVPSIQVLEDALLEVISKKSLFKSIKSEREFKIDPVISSFELLAQECLQRHPTTYIAAVVLNIHSTFDACFGCAPDLAQESVREDSFAGYFAHYADQLNRHLNRQSSNKPFFRTTYSCGKIRGDVRCADCSFATRRLESPVWERPQKIAYYQHHIPLKYQEKSGGGSHSVDMDNSTNSTSSDRHSAISASKSGTNNGMSAAKNADDDDALSSKESKKAARKKGN